MSDVLVIPAFVSSVPDSGDTTKLGPSAWNAARLFSGGTQNDVLVRDSGSATGASWTATPVLGDVTVTNQSGMRPNWFNYAAWGDSLTLGAGYVAYPTTLASLTGRVVFNGGVGGENSTQIKTRFLADTARLGNFHVIWSGRNDYASPATVKANIAAMVAALPAPKRFVVLSILNNDSAPEWSGGASYATIIQLNADLAALYPSNYLDVRAYMVSQFNAGIPQDVIDHGHDVSPSSLRVDALHFGSAGYSLIANFVYAWIIANDPALRAVPRWTDLLTVFATPPAIGSAAGNTIFGASGSVLIDSSGIILSTAIPLQWGSSGVSTPDLFLYRDAANILALRRDAANSQALRIYGPYTDASNYERLSISRSGGTGNYQIWTEKAGTGSARSLVLGANGTGSWSITSNGGHLFALTDNAFDIGAAGATRPRNLFVSGAVANRTKAGTPVDGDVNTPTDGMLVVDTTASKIWVRVGSAWKGVAVA